MEGVISTDIRYNSETNEFYCEHMKYVPNVLLAITLKQL
jgi:hypothetical protein